ncbi:MAG: hypothetical protein ACO38P_10195, partial [Phycisphaerales bacterium]
MANLLLKPFRLLTRDSAVDRVGRRRGGCGRGGGLRGGSSCFELAGENLEAGVALRDRGREIADPRLEPLGLDERLRIGRGDHGLGVGKLLLEAGTVRLRLLERCSSGLEFALERHCTVARRVALLLERGDPSAIRLGLLARSRLLVEFALQRGHALRVALDPGLRVGQFPAKRRRFALGPIEPRLGPREFARQLLRLALDRALRRGLETLRIRLCAIKFVPEGGAGVALAFAGALLGGEPLLEFGDLRRRR